MSSGRRQCSRRVGHSQNTETDHDHAPRDYAQVPHTHPVTRPPTRSGPRDLALATALNGTANGFDDALSVAVDNEGNVLAAGATVNTGTGTDFTVAKFDRDGTLLWQQTLNGTANDFDAALSVAVDNQGNVVAAGGTVNGHRR